MFSVAMLQLAQNSDPQQNLEIGLSACRKAKEMNADLAVFPEMWNVGYRLPDRGLSVEKWSEWAIDEDSEYFQRFVRCARDNEIAIALTYLKRNAGDNPSNAVAIIDKQGEVKLVYTKVHTCDFSAEKHLSPGSGFPVCELDVGHQRVILGAMICYDREFPESARVLMLKGAEIVVIPNACRMELNRTTQLRSRAFENMFGCALVNYAGGDCQGNSIAFDGMAFEDESGDYGSLDMQLVEASADQSITIAAFDLERLRRYRESESWGNAYRKPERYGAITDTAVSKPFLRSDAKR